VWVEIPVHDNYSLLIGNHYFPPDCDVKIIEVYLNFSEHNLSAHLYRVIILGDFTVPKYDWINGTPLPNCHYYSKIKGNLIQATSCLLGLYQHNSSVANGTLFDLVLTNINDLRVSVSDFPTVAPDNYHPPLHLNLKLTVDFQPAIMTPQRSYKHGDYLLLYTTLSNCDWSCVLNENSVDSAVHNLTVRMSEAINEAISSLIPNSSTFPHSFSSSLKYYTKKENNLKKNPITIIVCILIIVSWSKLLLRLIGWLG
jgi:hypothetical protein